MLSHQMVRLAGQELQQELALQRERLEGFRSLSPALRVRSSDTSIWTQFNDINRLVLPPNLILYNVFMGRWQAS